MDTNMTFRIDSQVKAQMAAICEQLGISTSTAFNIFANAFVRNNGMPFPLTLNTPSAEISREQMLADTDAVLSSFADDYKRIIKASGGLDGIRDRNSLEAAVNAPLQTFAGFDLFETDLAKIARIGFGLASNHAFLDGNKRIGAMMTQLLLKWNGYVLELKPGELADMFISIANGSAGEHELQAWIIKHLKDFSD